ncbi:MAG: DUF4011 domain-containing protein [Granulosicoccus sp.]|nr:DUF4011 domain-containing protein [Granulosicoccus sp.]
MEVLHGNQSGSKHSRRRADKISSGENRTLNWCLEESDIALYPHSPLALADVLSCRGGFLDLVPDQNAGKNTKSTTRQQDELKSTPPDLTEETAARHGNRDTRDRFNLLTCHSRSELLQQCKRVLVENALVKHKGDRQLYLAAGFISWPESAPESVPKSVPESKSGSQLESQLGSINAEQRRKAPILLFPALLMRVAGEPRYEIKLAGDIPEYNEALLIQLEKKYSITLPAYEEATPLVDFFARIAECLQKVTALQLEFDVALGSASLIHDPARNRKLELPDVPVNFNVGLAMSITGNKSLNQLNAVLRLIPDFDQRARHAEEQANSASTDAGISGLRKFAAKLAAEGLDHVTFKRLPAMPSIIRQCSATVRKAMACDTLINVLDLDDLSARELIKLSGIIELIDKAPATLEILGHPDLCYNKTSILLTRAQHQAKLIDDEFDALQEHFLLDKIPPKQQLLSLISDLGESNDNDQELVDSTYFNARRQYMEFSKHKPKVLATEDKRSLAQLAKVLRFRELFVNNAEYRAALGPGYKGLRTDWNTLLVLSQYARELSEVIGSEAIAAKIVRKWPEFRQHYAMDLACLQQASEATRQLLSAVGSRWQTQTIPALLSHAKMIAQRLEDWQQQHGTIDSHADKTASMILASFSGESLDHVLVESQVDETHSRIYQQLHAGEVSREQISDTLSWLQEASSAAARQDLDIDAIVEHLQIA